MGIELHAVKITAANNGYSSKVEIDGQEVKGALSVRVDIQASNLPPKVTLELFADIDVAGEAEIVTAWREAFTHALPPTP